MHGLPESRLIYDELIPLLTAVGRRVLAFDFLGFGASDKPAGAPRVTGLAALSRRGLWRAAALLALAPSIEVAASLFSPSSAKAKTAMSDDKPASALPPELAAAAALTTKVLAIGTWTAKATPQTRPPIMPLEARDTIKLMLAGKIDQWFAKSDGSGAVFLMNLTDTVEAHHLLEALPLGQAQMMTFELIKVGPLWPLGLLVPPGT